MLVTSKYDHFALRSTHRKFFNRTLLRKLGIGRRLFVLGNPPPYHKVSAAAAPQLQAEIQAENAISGDLIQGDFIDNYRNLSIKHLLALHYVKDYCKNFRYKTGKTRDCNSFEEKSITITHSHIKPKNSFSVHYVYSFRVVKKTCKIRTCKLLLVILNYQTTYPFFPQFCITQC